MALLADIYITAEKLKTLAETVAKKGDKGISLTFSVDDKTNEYGQNASLFVSQSKEERDAKKTKFYAGNGKVFWTDGKVSKAEPKQAHTPKQEYHATVSHGDDQLPF